MPKFLENDLVKSGKKHGFTGKTLAKYVYGGMNNLGAMKGNQITEKGEEMQKKHDRDTAKRS